MRNAFGGHLLRKKG